MTDRIELIRTRLIEFIEAMGVGPAIPSRETWTAYPLPPSLQTGWLPPVIAADDPPLMIAFCPEIIADQTNELDDHDLSAYLDMIEFSMSRHVQYFIEQPDTAVEDRTVMILDELYDNNADAAAFFLEIQARALDAAQ